ncbi:OmpA family protein [Cytophagales bacterium LB-30]|uniref:OmpA family protein n=1 Tax=Shiella aurantiaca TaxID=3058365 RepID=A0ABT8F790_9BACT|nr:OmpA family protein [Shiella aurantiaca]
MRFFKKQYFLPFLCGVAVACSPLKRAEKKFERGEYDIAINYYESLAGKKSFSKMANYYAAESYRLSNRIHQAAPYYQAAIEAGFRDEGAMVYYAFALKAIGEYDAAKEQLENYLDSAEDKAYITLAENELYNLKRLNEIRAKKNYFEVKNLNAINTPSAEYSPVFNNGFLFFTTSRDSDKVYKATGTGFTDLYKAETKGARVDTTTIQSLGAAINDPEINEGSITFSPDGNFMVFAKGNNGKRRGTAEVNLYQSRQRGGRWSEPLMMTISDPRFWDSTPAFSADGRTLYFASNRLGGYGGTDLYSATLDGRGRWGNVKNLGAQINTPGNEMFPHVTEDGKLFFSSDGHPGFGGLDILVAERKNGTIEITNIGSPMNSTADDFGIYLFMPDRGFFSSNRAGGEGDDDIYTFVNNDPDLKIVNYFLAGVTYTYDEEEKEQILPGTQVRLLDKNENILAEVITGMDGKFNFRVSAGEEYLLMGEKREFFTTRAPFSTVGREIPKDSLKQLVTNKTFNAKITLDKIVLDKSIVLNNIYYDLDKSDIRADAALELDKLVNVLKDNPQIRIELSSHTDLRSDDDYNLRLSQRRAESAVAYIIKHGIASDRIVARGYGETKPIILNAQTEEEHERNRRTEFKVIGIDKSKEAKEEKVVEDGIEFDFDLN